MSRKRFTVEQIIDKLRETDIELFRGLMVEVIC